MPLDARQRAIFTALADKLIPDGAALPSATRAGVPSDAIDEVLRYRPDLAANFGDALRRCAGRDPESALDDLAANHPAQFTALTLLTAGAYVLSQQVLSALGLSAPPQPVNDDTDTYIESLADVVERGFELR